ncbi:hypothetical protein [Mycoplasmoides alvi]|uniref:hypothetical protein n=1 Tax=Mycoplasmoides alvi TaxID=78580 RepID=UPI00051C8E71|nr:hypothetical protein [Mycoplasmoides alvi]
MNTNNTNKSLKTPINTKKKWKKIILGSSLGLLSLGVIASTTMAIITSTSLTQKNDVIKKETSTNNLLQKEIQLITNKQELINSELKDLSNQLSQERINNSDLSAENEKLIKLIQNQEQMIEKTKQNIADLELQAKNLTSKVELAESEKTNLSIRLSNQIKLNESLLAQQNNTMAEIITLISNNKVLKNLNIGTLDNGSDAAIVQRVLSFIPQNRFGLQINRAVIISNNMLDRAFVLISVGSNNAIDILSVNYIVRQ